MLVRPVYRPRMPSLALGLVGWWPFDGGSLIDQTGRFIKTGSKTTAVPCGGIAPGVGGKQRGAFNLTATSSQLDLGNDTCLSGATAMTIAFWVNPSAVASNRLVTKWSSTSTSQSYLTALSASKPEFAVSHGDAINFVIVTATSQTVSTNAWQHICWTWTGNTAIGYLNGKTFALTYTQQNTVTTLPAGTVSIQVGLESAESSNGTPGLYDDLRLYNRQLSPAEVLALYAEPFQPVIDIETIAMESASIQAFLAAWARQRNSVHQGWAT